MIELHISYDKERGEVAIKGPLDRTVDCLGMLEAAKLSVYKHAAAASDEPASPIVIPHIGRPI